MDAQGLSQDLIGRRRTLAVLEEGQDAFTHATGFHHIAVYTSW
jgi:hypothetical protein